MFARHYDRNLIITMGIASSPWLKKKVEETLISTSAIQIQFDGPGVTGKMLPLSTADKKEISLLTGNSRLYIEGHGDSNIPSVIITEEKNFITYQQLAEIIAKNVDQSNIGGLRINLKVCQAAKDYQPTHSSFGSLLSSRLSQFGMHDVEIIAYHDDLIFSQNPFNDKVYEFSVDTREKEILNLKLDKLSQSLSSFQLARENINQEIVKIKNAFPAHPSLSLATMFCTIMMGDFCDMLVKHKTSNYIDSTMSTMKIMNHISPNKKFIFTHDDGQPIKCDYAAIKKWDKETRRALIQAGLMDKTVTYNQNRTYSNKFNFLRSLQSESNENSVVADRLNQAEKLRIK